MDSKACTRTKKDLVEHVAAATGQSKSAVRRTIQDAFDYIVDELADGNRLEFREFGVFDAKVRPGRIAQNPKTLQPVHVPARRSVKFKPSRSMRDRLRIEEADAAASDSSVSSVSSVSSSAAASQEMIAEALQTREPVEVVSPVAVETSNGVASPTITTIVSSSEAARVTI